MLNPSRWQMATIKRQGVRVKDARQQDPNHLMEFDFQIPLDRETAEEILPALAVDLFDKHGHAKAEIQAMDVVIPNLNLQVLTVKDHPDADVAVGVFRTVSIRKVTVHKSDDQKSFVLVFTAGWILGADDAEMDLIRRIKKGSIYLNLSPEQPGMALEPEDGTEATDTPKKKKAARRTRRDPEGEHARQMEAGAAAAAADPGVEEVRPGVVAEFGDETTH